MEKLLELVMLVYGNLSVHCQESQSERLYLSPMGKSLKVTVFLNFCSSLLINICIFTHAYIYLVCYLSFFSGGMVVHSLYITSKHEGSGSRPAEIVFFRASVAFLQGLILSCL